jgi:hypothetical protein
MLRATSGKDSECLFVSVCCSYTVGIPILGICSCVEWQQHADNYSPLPAAEVTGERIDISIIPYAFVQSWGKKRNSCT